MIINVKVFVLHVGVVIYRPDRFPPSLALTVKLHNIQMWERPAETGHRARMIYFEKNGFQYSTRVFVRKKAFHNKNNGTIGKSRNKSIDVGAWFFFKDAAYDYERVKQSAFYVKKAPRALGGPFLLDAPIYKFV